MPNKHQLVMRMDSGEMSAGDGPEEGAGAAGFSGPREGARRHLQSVDSNHMESQSEWSDDELGRDGEGDRIRDMKRPFINLSLQAVLKVLAT